MVSGSGDRNRLQYYAVVLMEVGEEMAGGPTVPRYATCILTGSNKTRIVRVFVEMVS